MTFRNPLTSLPADAITSGTFTGTYRNAGTFILAGDPAASHVQASGTELVFYGADGVTKLVDLDTSSGAGTITGGIIQTAAAGPRWVMEGPTPGGLINRPSDQILGYCGITSEVGPGGLLVRNLIVRGPGGGGDGRSGAVVSIGPPDLGGGGGSVSVFSKDSTDPTSGANQVMLTADQVQVIRDGDPNTLTGGSDVFARDILTGGTTSATTATVGGTVGRVAVVFTTPLLSAPNSLWVAPRVGFSQYQIVPGTISSTGFTFQPLTGAGATLANGVNVNFHYGAMV